MEAQNENESKEKDYGHVLDSENNKIQIDSFVRAIYIDNRLISVMKLEDGSYTLAVENHQSSGRSIQSTMRLSEESFVGLVSTIFMFFQCSNTDVQSLLEKSISEDKLIDYMFSDNLKPFKP